MIERTFKFNNPNADIFIVPQQQGGAEDDNYFGSIGDATAQHISRLTHHIIEATPVLDDDNTVISYDRSHIVSNGDRLLWEELIVTKNGLVLRAVPSWYNYERDLFNLRGKDLEEHKKKQKDDYIANTILENKLARQPDFTKEQLTLLEEQADDFIESLEEVYEEEAERRETSEDVLDRGELIPFDQWERFPQMWKHIDIPTTPRDILLYMGDTSQSFYDEWPEGHPDKELITSFLNILNRPGDLEIDSGYAQWACEWLDAHRSRKYTRHYLKALTWALVSEDEDPNILVARALESIDRCWSIEYKNAVAQKCLKDKMLRVIMFKEKEWESLAKKGFSVYANIKAFGKLLYQNYRKTMNGYHWHRYYRAKTKYAPHVISRGFDINRCRIKELQQALHTDKPTAERIWYARPFESVAQLYNKGYISSSAFYDDKQTEKIILWIEKNAKDLQRLNGVRQQLIKAQRGSKVQISADQWRMVWNYYTLLKAELLDAIAYEQEETQGETRHV